MGYRKLIRIYIRDFFRAIVAANSKRSTPNETKFTEAEKNWNLEKLYEDLRAAKQRCGSGKRKVLTEIEKCHLRGLLCGFSDKEIANKRGVVLGTVSDTLSKTLYRYIEELLDYEEEIRHWSNVRDLLEKAGYKIQVSEQSQPSHSLPNEKENTLEISHNVNSIREWRFKSVDQLWSKDIGECISGIRKLERIAKDYPTEHWAIMEELAEFIRIRTRWQEGEEERSPNIPIDIDIQAALTVIGRRNSEKDLPNLRLDLSKTDISGALLTEANLQGATLSKANLQGAYLKDAKLQGADLTEANLQGAKLWGAELQKAKLRGTKLERAVLNGAELQGAILDGANLKYAYLWYIKLQEAQLKLTNLEGAILKEADLQGATLDGANLKGAFLNGTNIEGVSLAQAYLEGADLSEAKNLQSWQIEKAFGDSKTLLPDHIEAPAHWTQSG